MKRILIVMMVVCAGFGIQSCKKNKEASQGQMEVRMTDSPGDFVALNMEIMKIEAYLENSGWVTINETTKEINILDLTNGAEVTIASSTSVQAGVYSKLRLTFSGENSLTFNGANGSNTVNLSFSSNDAHQVEIPIHCEVNVGVTSSILLDFNVGSSIAENGGGYTLNPVISEIVDPSTGIQGNVSGSAKAAISLSNASHNASTYTNANGYFMIKGVPDGTYLLKIEAKGPGEEVASQKSIQNVTITKGQIKSLGSIQI
nr:DUF4382 domain-containing protein [uncultured Fluviicola sp.]